MHYLICHADKKVVVHLRRGDGQWNTTMVPGGMLTLDPPGVTIKDFESEISKVYEKYYEIYRSLYPATRSAMSRLTDLATGSTDQ